MQWTPAAIRRHRVLRGWNQDDAANALGVSRRSISSWESGEARPQGRHADALDRVIGTPAPSDDPTLSQASFMQLVTALVARHGEDADRIAELLRKLGEAERADPVLPAQDLEWPRQSEPQAGHSGSGGA